MPPQSHHDLLSISAAKYVEGLRDSFKPTVSLNRTETHTHISIHGYGAVIGRIIHDGSIGPNIEPILFNR